ncbi:UNVERIFIED_CONTAM: Ethanolamine-phosphate cytidylyltransferase [Sesamum angustifolium]|uniref:ethanolamine-phosphate cytidylyltransferase n=1 Tax=Sesamum angustifolium TaxID=2727405 RepID=A0AAW2N6X1_9LAMI
MHYGHANALRQAKALGDELVVGVVSDEEIISNKGPPVLSMQERLALVSGLKWVDEVIPNAPYEITEDFMNRLFKEHKIDYIIHGDDPCLLPDGTDAYALAKKVGRYKQIKRTEGVSSTDIVGRILSCMKDAKSDKLFSESSGEVDNLNNTQSSKSQVNGGHISHFLPTSRRIVQFSNGKGPGPNSRVVYIDGAFDLFHAGHVEILKSAKQLGDFLLVGIYADHTVSEVRSTNFPLMNLHERSLSVLACRYVDEVIIGAPWEVTKDMILKRARQLGDFLLVGIYSDQTVSELRGSHFPLMNLHERSLSVLACRYVDEVIIGAPWEVTKDMITTFNISLVVRGTISEKNPLMNGKSDPYVVPKSMGIFQMLESPKDITTTSIAKRIIANHEIYLKRNAKKEASEKKYYAEKKYVAVD